jgi:hypothetical protein
VFLIEQNHLHAVRESMRFGFAVPFLENTAGVRPMYAKLTARAAACGELAVDDYVLALIDLDD